MLRISSSQRERAGYYTPYLAISRIISVASLDEKCFYDEQNIRFMISCRLQLSIAENA